MNENLNNRQIRYAGIAWLTLIFGSVTLFVSDYRMRLTTGDIRLGGVPYEIRDFVVLALFAAFLVFLMIGSSGYQRLVRRILFCLLHLLPALLLFWVALFCYYLGYGIDTL